MSSNVVVIDAILNQVLTGSLSFRSCQQIVCPSFNVTVCFPINWYRVLFAQMLLEMCWRNKDACK